MRLTKEQLTAIDGAVECDVCMYNDAFCVKIFGVSFREEDVLRALKLLAIVDGLTDAQRLHLREHCTNIAEEDDREAAGTVLYQRDGEDFTPAMSADAHRAVVRIMGGGE